MEQGKSIKRNKLEVDPSKIIFLSENSLVLKTGALRIIYLRTSYYYYFLMITLIPTHINSANPFHKLSYFKIYEPSRFITPYFLQASIYNAVACYKRTL